MEGEDRRGSIHPLIGRPVVRIFRDGESYSGYKAYLTCGQSYMGTSPGGPASLVTRNRRYAGGEV